MDAVNRRSDILGDGRNDLHSLMPRSQAPVDVTLALNRLSRPPDRLTHLVHIACKRVSGASLEISRESSVNSDHRQVVLVYGGL